MEKNLFEEITRNAIVNKDQGYVFYFQLNDKVIKKINGKEGNDNSNNIGFNTHFRLASVSKQFIAMGIINLVNDNNLDYDTNIFSIFNELPMYFHKITIKNLLNHTSGIYDYEDIPHLETDPQIKDKEIISFLKTTTKTYFEPGSKYRYSNTGYILLGLIIEKISGQSIDTYLKNKVFYPANLNETFVNYQGITTIPNRALGHVLENNQLIVKDQYWCSATIGDGGLYSNLDDLNKWLDYLIKNKSQLEETMFKPNILANNENTEYGFGMRITKLSENYIYYHCGDTIGTNTLILFCPSINLRCIFLTNFGGIDTNIIKDNILNFLKSNHFNK